jgi:hypothetical protein
VLRLRCLSYRHSSRSIRRAPKDGWGCVWLRQSPSRRRSSSLSRSASCPGWTASSAIASPGQARTVEGASEDLTAKSSCWDESRFSPRATGSRSQSRTAVGARAPSRAKGDGFISVTKNFSQPMSAEARSRGTRPLNRANLRWVVSTRLAQWRYQRWP